MSERFIKLYPSDELQWLLINHANAFILLSLIALRARRQNGNPDGLIIGDALIGSDDLKPGMSRQNFRTALEKLVEFGYIKIISNGKKLFVDRKSTIKVTIKGMLVNLVKSTIYDINPENGNQQANQRLTNDQPTGNHKQEGIRSISNDIPKEEEAQPAKRLRSKDFLSFDFEKWEFQGMTEKELANWKIMYPHIDVKIEILKAAQWVKSNPSKSNKKHWRKFLTGWLQRGNDRAENQKAYKTSGGYQGPDRRTKDIEGNPVENQYKGKF
jgi:hypothetical protein